MSRTASSMMALSCAVATVATIASLVCVAGFGASAHAQGLTVSPQTSEQLDGIFAELAKRHPSQRWCTSSCFTLYEARLRGRLADGALELYISGAVTSDDQAYVELFGTKPAVGVDELTSQSGGRVPLYWSGSAYSAVLPPGDFTLRGTLRVGKESGVLWRLPAPVGLVSIDVPDADVVGTGERRGVAQATYQLAPRLTGTASAAPEQSSRLRLSVLRSFTLARDKTFTTTLEARGARPGQVIAVALLPNEMVEELDAAVGHVVGEGASRRIDWIASGSQASLSYGGQWTGAEINLVAPGGAVRESWEVRCDDPYLCSFDGDAEPSPGATTHAWSPLPGQKLSVTWKELSPLAGVHTLAQRATLATRPTGRNLQQRLAVDWLSSSGSLVALRLPDGAVVNRFELDGVATPVLKDPSGAVQVNLPTGSSRLQVAWEIASAASSFTRPPAPSFSVPVGTMSQQYFPDTGKSVVLTGGLAGSPRIALWPNLAATLALALLTVFLGRRAHAPIARERLFVLAALGFALLSPATVLPLLLALGCGRLLASVRRERGRVRAFFELALWASLCITAVVIALVALQQALFDESPIDVTSFVSVSDSWVGESFGYPALSWSAYLAGSMDLPAALPSPWVLAVPVLFIRLMWAAWAVVLGLFLAAEGRLMLSQLAAYWQRVRRPAPPRPAPSPAPTRA